jgi:hypothetical protein
MASTTVSVEGDLTYRDALAMLARSRGTTIAKMVREALDTTYGDEIGSYDSFIRATSGTRKRQNKRGTQKLQMERAK